MAKKEIPQREIIIKFITKNPKLTTREIADQLGINYDSVRGRVSDLKKNKLLEVNEDHEYTAVENWYKKLLKTGQTKKPLTGKTSENIEIYTYQVDDENIMQKLLDAAIDNIAPDLQYIDTLGYDSSPIEPFEVEKQYRYPNALLIITNYKKIDVVLNW